MLDRELNEPRRYQPLPTVAVRLVSIITSNTQICGPILHLRSLHRHDGFNGRCVFGSHLQLHRQGLSFLNQPAGIPDRLFFVYLIAHERHIPYDQRVFATPAYGPGHQDHFIHGHRVKITLGTYSYLVGGLTRTRAYFCRSVLGFTLCLSGNVSNPEAEAAKIVEPDQRDWNILSKMVVHRGA